MLRPTVIPTSKGFQYEEIFDFKKNWKKPKKSDLVSVKIKSYQIDGVFIGEKEATIDLAKLSKNKNTAKLQQGIRKMNIGDKYRFFIPIKIDYDPELFVDIASPLIKIYEVELLDILKKDGSAKFPKETARYIAVTKSDNFNTQNIYKLAHQKAYVKRQRAEIRHQQRAMYGGNTLETIQDFLYILECL